MKKALVAVFFLGLIAVFNGCETGQPKQNKIPGVLDKIVVDPASADVEKGNIFYFSAKGFDAFGTEVPVPALTWSVESQYSGIIALVNPKGPKAAVRAKASGAAEVVVAMGEVKTVVSVNVAGQDKFTSRTSK